MANLHEVGNLVLFENDQPHKSRGLRGLPLSLIIQEGNLTLERHHILWLTNPIIDIVIASILIPAAP